LCAALRNLDAEVAHARGHVRLTVPLSDASETTWQIVLVAAPNGLGTDAGEPSMPTSTGACAGWAINGSSSWITATGQCA
jgi:hypothetical protein